MKEYIVHIIVFLGGAVASLFTFLGTRKPKTDQRIDFEKFLLEENKKLLLVFKEENEKLRKTVNELREEILLIKEELSKYKRKFGNA